MYKMLARSQRRRYPVTFVSNNGALSETFADIIKVLQCERPFSALGKLNPDSAFFDNSTGATNAAIARPMFNVFSKLSPAKPTVVYDTYWRFAAERQAIFFRRLQRQPPPWTEDQILRVHKVTNAYRASDRTSQYLIR